MENIIATAWLLALMTWAQNESNVKVCEHQEKVILFYLCWYPVDYDLQTKSYF